MKKVLSIVLALMLVTGLCATAKVAYVPINAGGGNGMGAVKPEMLHNNISVYTSVCDGNTVSQRITAKKPIGGIALYLPSWENSIGKITIRIYKWDSTYQKSLQGKPIGEKTFVDTPDNEQFAVMFTSNANDILIHASNGEDKMGMWVPTVTPVIDVTQTTYINGQETNYCVPTGIIWAPEETEEKKEEVSVPNKNPYEFITPGDRDENVGFRERQASDHYDGDGSDTFYGMFDIDQNTKNGSYAVFKNVDFGKTSPERLLFRVFERPVTNFNEMQFIIDDLNGEIIASARWFFDYNKHGSKNWVEIVSDVSVPVTGVHDLYMVFRQGNSDCTIGKFKFLKEEIPLTEYEKELEDFKPVADSELKKTYSDTWVATDMVGRKLPDYSTVGDKKDKQIGLFYWTWTAGQGYLTKTFSNNQSVIDNYPGDINEIKNTMHPAWGDPGFWNESVYGHYMLFDTWVMRKHLELLSSAGVDFIATDCSNNASMWGTGTTYMMREMHKMRQLGYNVPKITFILPWSANAGTTTDLEMLYTGYFANGLYSDCWYYYDGKPLVMAYPGGDLLKETGNEKVDAMHKEISEFFTFRGAQPKYKAGQTATLQWPWSEVAPQHGFMKKADGTYEIVAVSVAQNSNDAAESYTAMNGEGVYGRSYTYKEKHNKLSDTSLFYGYNFQEQWDNAFKINPEIIFITGWNEWIAGHFEGGGGTDVKAAYVDEWSDEYSRDAEPTKGQLKDTYYLQMVSNIRKFKGVNPTPVAENAKTVDVKGDFAQWSEVGPEFIGFEGGTEARRGDLGFGGRVYTNNTGRNDIVLSKVSQDAEKLYFYVETAQNLTPDTDKNWMRLYINTDRKRDTGWEGYDFVVNRVAPVSGQLVVEKYAGKDNNYKYAEAVKVDYKTQGNKLMLEIPKSELGITGATDIEFKWHDNGVNDGNILDFYENGDAAPVGRFNYRYVEESAVNKKVADEPVDVFSNLDVLTRKYVIMGLNKPFAYAKGNRQMIDPNNENIVPMIVNDKTLVPIRFISESIGANVSWNDETQSATITLLGKRMVIKEGSNTMKIERETKKLQTPAQTFNDRMYVPLRDVSEAFGLDCYWADPGLIVIGNGANITMNIYYDLTDRLMERIELK